ncbi:MAG: 6,7-dimethyl-8-ribityllumazine synthase [Gammaproteobacteria bacterium]
MSAQPPIFEEPRNAQGLRIAVVAARFNNHVVERLLDGATGSLRGAGAATADVEVLRVPGAFEIPLAVRQAARSGRFEAVIALGAVIRGETSHFDYVAGECARGVMQVMLDSGVPVGFGVLTCDTLAQAEARAGGAAGNKGADAARAAVEMANLLRQWTH